MSYELVSKIQKKLDLHMTTCFSLRKLVIGKVHMIIIRPKIENHKLFHLLIAQNMINIWFFFLEIFIKGGKYDHLV